MKVHPSIAAVAGLVTLAVVSGGTAYAEPVLDSVASINEMTREAERLSETIVNAQPDLDKKLQLLHEADQKHTDDLAGLALAKSELATYQGGVDRFAAAVNMGGRANGMSALLSAPSPAVLIDKLATQQVMGDQMSTQLQGLRRAEEDAQAIEAASAQSAAAAKTAVDEAAAFRADLQNKRAELRNQLATVNASYAKLPAAQQAGLTLPSAAVTQTALGPIAPSVLAERMHRDRARTSRVLTSLIQKKLVLRTTPAHDRRSAIVGLTPEGRKVYDSLMPQVQAINSQILSTLAPEAAQGFDAALERLQARAETLVTELSPDLPKANRRQGQRGKESV